VKKYFSPHYDNHKQFPEPSEPEKCVPVFLIQKCVEQELSGSSLAGDYIAVDVSDYFLSFINLSADIVFERIQSLLQGISIIKVAPLPSRLSARMVPPCSVMIP
jgi:hypothetical protein